MPEIQGRAPRVVGEVVDLPEHEQRSALVTQVAAGRLGSQISRLQLPDGTCLYLKEGKGEAAADLRAEFQRLEWLNGRLPVPTAQQLASADPGAVRLLLSGLAGQPAHRAPLTVAKLAEVLAQALRAIHAVPAATCPFGDVLDCELAEAERRLSAGRIRLDGFLGSTGGLSPATVLDQLHRTRGMIQETVFTHGDYCLPNVIIHEGQLSGVIDWGIAGVADLHRDLAIAKSLAFNLGAAAVDPFFEAYGGDGPDPERVRYYALLDAFFAPSEISSP